MPIVGLQLVGKLTGPPQTNRRTFHIDQQGVAGQRPYPLFHAQPPVRKHQATLAFARKLPLAAQQPFPCLLQCRQQWRPPTRSQACQPWLQGRRGFQSVALPARRIAAGGQQRQTRAGAIGLVEEGRQYTLGPAQGLMTPGRGRGIDDHQPEFGGLGTALLPAQVAALAWTPVQQGRRPVEPALPGRAPTATRALGEPAGLGPGIRAGAGTDAQGFFGQVGTSRRAPAATGWAGISPHCPLCACGVCDWAPACGGVAGGCALESSRA